MKFTVENYRGIKSARFTLDRISLVAAENAAGKSALAQAVGAVLCGQPIPIQGVSKIMSAMLVRNGSDKGYAMLEQGETNARIDWPRATFKTRGEPPRTSAITAGLDSIAPPLGSPDDAARQKKRAETLIEFLSAHPTIENLISRFKNDGISDDTARAIWAVVEKQGWSAAHSQAKETGARLKGQWEAVTGENYGSKKADGYTPTNWEPELSGSSEDALQASLTDARDALEGMIAVTAVDEAEQAALKALADKLDERKGVQDEATQAVERATAAQLETEKKLSSLRPPKKEADQECPHCKGLLNLINGKAVAFEPDSPEHCAAWAAASEAVATAGLATAAAKRVATEAAFPVRESENASKKLANLTQGNATQEQVNAAREAVTNAQNRLAAFIKKTKSDRLQESILQNLCIVAALDITGVRQEVVSQSVSRFLTDTLAPLAQVAGWPQIDIAPSDMSLTFDGRAWALLSESEQYRVRALLQVAFAVREKASAIVIDAADILDRAGRNALLNLVTHTGIPAVICMTYPSARDTPDFGAAEIGLTYWIGDGVLTPLSEAQ